MTRLTKSIRSPVVVSQSASVSTTPTCCVPAQPYTCYLSTLLRHFRCEPWCRLVTRARAVVPATTRRARGTERKFEKGFVQLTPLTDWYMFERSVLQSSLIVVCRRATLDSASFSASTQCGSESIISPSISQTTPSTIAVFFFRMFECLTIPY